MELHDISYSNSCHSVQESKNLELLNSLVFSSDSDSDQEIGAPRFCTDKSTNELEVTNKRFVTLRSEFKSYDDCDDLQDSICSGSCDHETTDGKNVLDHDLNIKPGVAECMVKTEYDIKDDADESDTEVKVEPLLGDGFLYGDVQQKVETYEMSHLNPELTQDNRFPNIQRKRYNYMKIYFCYTGPEN